MCVLCFVHRCIAGILCVVFVGGGEEAGPGVTVAARPVPLSPGFVNRVCTDGRGSADGGVFRGWVPR